jgi:TM2 domain-containing membrane protein YozV
MGVHRFYLGQVGLGILYLFLIPVAWLLGIIDALAFFSMDQEEFDRKYNKEYYRRREEERAWARDRDRDRDRRRSREYEREDRRQAPERKKKDAAHKQPAGNPYRDSGVKKFKDFDYDGAIADFEKSLSIAPADIATHFNIACAYSLIENKDKAFYHLDRAVALGFNDWERIKTHDALAYVRIQDEYLAFQQNGYRLAAQLDAQADTPQQDLLSSTPSAATSTPSLSQDLLEQLKRLGELRERGLLTEEEFSSQKKKLLG